MEKGDWLYLYHPLPLPSTNHGPWRVPGSLPASQVAGDPQLSSSTAGCRRMGRGGAARCHGGASPEATTCANDEDDEGAMHH